MIPVQAVLCAGPVAEFVKARSVIVNLLKKRLLRRDLDEIFRPLIESTYTTNAEIRIEGAGQAEVRATDRANVVIEGVGEVDFAGRPANLTQEVSGIGSVNISND